MAIGINVIAQDYIPLVKEGASWLIFSHDDVGYNADEYWNFIIEEDTLVNDQTYNKVILKKLEPVENTDTYKVLDVSVFALLREELDNKRVYCIKLQNYKWGMYNCEINEEFVLYDFNHSIGDEIVSCNTLSDPGMPIIVQDISQELIFDESRTVLDYGDFLANWIEGVGHSTGLFASTTNLIQLANTVLVLVEYCNDLTQCDVLLDNLELPVEDDFKIYPNPADNILSFSSNKYIESIEIYDYLGQMVLKRENPKATVNISSLLKGTYFIHISINDKNQIIKKLIKI